MRITMNRARGGGKISQGYGLKGSEANVSG